MAIIPDAFTKKYLKEELTLITDVGISHVFDELHQKQVPKPFISKALWDTGASHCFITASLAQKLFLHPISKTKVEHANGWSYEKVYLLNLHITPKYYVEVELSD